MRVLTACSDSAREGREIDLSELWLVARPWFRSSSLASVSTANPFWTLLLRACAHHIGCQADEKVPGTGQRNHQAGTFLRLAHLSTMHRLIAGLWPASAGRDREEVPMATSQSTPVGPDLTQGIPASDLLEGRTLTGHVGEEAVLLARTGGEVFAIGAKCTHYGGPLADGLMVGDTVRCPWHHACFSLRTGEAPHAPAFSPVSCWGIQPRDGRIFVRSKAGSPAPGRKLYLGAGNDAPKRIVIVGGGAAGFAAAENLRRQGHGGSIVMVSDDDEAPVDRPNLSKDYLAGNAPEDWVPLQPNSFYREKGIDLRLGTTAASIDVANGEVVLSDSSSDSGRLSYDRLLLATGAEPVRLSIPGAD